METKAKLSDQEIIDRVVRSMIRQGRKSVGVDKTFCMYLSPNDDRCAVGCLFKTDPETNDRARRLNGSVQSLYLRGEEHILYVNIGDFLDFELGEDQMPLLAALQTAHDQSPYDNHFLTAFKANALQIAGLLNLNTALVG